MVTTTTTTTTTTRAVNYDAKTGDVIDVRLPGWPARAYFYVAATTPRTVALRELKHATQQTPGRFAGTYTYERLRQYGAVYAEA